MKNSKLFTFVTGLLSIGIVFLIGSYYFPKAIVIDNYITLIIATIMYYLISSLFALLCGVVIIGIAQNDPRRVNTIAALSLITCFLVSYFGLIITDCILSGFDIVGFLPQLIIVLLTSAAVCRINLKITIRR